MSKARDLANAGTALSAVSATELAFVDGVTSAIQTQLDAKTAKSTLTTTGDIYYASAANTPARLGIGTATQLLAVNSGATAPEWVAAPSSGGMTLLSTTTLSGTSTTISSISQSYQNLVILIQGITINVSDEAFTMSPNNASIATYSYLRGTTADNGVNESIKISGNNSVLRTGGANVFITTIYNYASSTYRKPFEWSGTHLDNNSASKSVFGGGGLNTASAISSTTISCGGGNSFSGGQVLIYGVK
jgi:hypothetical protein